MWCITTSGLKFWMFRVTLLNLSMNNLRDSRFSWWMWTRTIEVRCCSRLVVKCVPNLEAKVSKQLMEFGGSLVNQLKALPFSEVGNTQHSTTLSKVYNVHVFIGVDRPVIAVYVQAFPHNQQLCSHHVVSEWLSTGYFQGVSHGDRPVQMGLALGLRGVSWFRLLDSLNAGRGGAGLPSWVAWSARWTSLCQLPFHLFILPSESKNLLFILLLHLSHFSRSPWFSLTPSTFFLLSNFLGPTVDANCSWMRLKPREWLPSFSVSRLVCPSPSSRIHSLYTSCLTTPHLPELRTRMVLAKGTLTLK